MSDQMSGFEIIFGYLVLVAIVVALSILGLGIYVGYLR
jgi:hypothetical protein